MTKRKLGSDDRDDEKVYFSFAAGSPEAHDQLIRHVEYLNSLGAARYTIRDRMKDGGELERYIDTVQPTNSTPAKNASPEEALWKQDRVMPDDVPCVNHGLFKWGSNVRFTPDGYAYEMQPGETDPAPREYPRKAFRAVQERREEYNKANGR